MDIINLEQYFPSTQYVSARWFNVPMEFKVENRKGKPYKDGVANLASVTTHFGNIINGVKDDIADYYLNGLKTLNEPVKIVDPEWNDWLKENQHLVGPMGLSGN